MIDSVIFLGAGIVTSAYFLQHVSAKGHHKATQWALGKNGCNGPTCPGQVVSVMTGPLLGGGHFLTLSACCQGFATIYILKSFFIK